jgi:hypothetical protein
MTDTPPPETHDFIELMKTCWHEDPSIRPTFLEIMTRFSSYSALRSDTERHSRYALHTLARKPSMSIR